MSALFSASPTLYKNVPLAKKRKAMQTVCETVNARLRRVVFAIYGSIRSWNNGSWRSQRTLSKTLDGNYQADTLLDKRPRGDYKVSGRVFHSATSGWQY